MEKWRAANKQKPPVRIERENQIVSVIVRGTEKVCGGISLVLFWCVIGKFSGVTALNNTT